MLRKVKFIIFGAIIIIVGALSQGNDFSVPIFITWPCGVGIAVWPLLQELYSEYKKNKKSSYKDEVSTAQSEDVKEANEVKEFSRLMAFSVIIAIVFIVAVLKGLSWLGTLKIDYNESDKGNTQEQQIIIFQEENKLEQQSNEQESERKLEQQSSDTEPESKSEQQSNGLETGSRLEQHSKEEQKSTLELQSESNIISETEEDKGLVAQSQQEVESKLQNINNNIYGLESISGRISYTDQEDEYKFIPQISGIYRFDISELMNETYITISIKDRFGDSLGHIWIGSNNEGITLFDAEAGQEYTLVIRQQNGFSDYKISIGYQCPTEPLSEHMEGEIKYKDQVNNYIFVPAVSGVYRLDFQEIISGATFEVKVYDRLGYVVNSKYIGNEEGITVSEMVAGEEYKIEVKQSSGASKYIMDLGVQKPTLDISNMTNVGGQITYKDQQDIYTFVPTLNTDYELKLSEITEGAYINVRIIDRLGYCVKERTIGAGEAITVQSMIAGEEYKIIVEHNYGYSIYIMSIVAKQE